MESSYARLCFSTSVQEERKNGVVAYAQYGEKKSLAVSLQQAKMWFGGAIFDWLEAVKIFNGGRDPRRLLPAPTSHGGRQSVFLKPRTHARIVAEISGLLLLLFNAMYNEYRIDACATVYGRPTLCCSPSKSLRSTSRHSSPSCMIHIHPPIIEPRKASATGNTTLFRKFLALHLCPNILLLRPR